MDVVAGNVVVLVDVTVVVSGGDVLTAVRVTVLAGAVIVDICVAVETTVFVWTVVCTGSVTVLGGSVVVVTTVTVLPLFNTANAEPITAATRTTEASGINHFENLILSHILICPSFLLLLLLLLLYRALDLQFHSVRIDALPTNTPRAFLNLALKISTII